MSEITSTTDLPIPESLQGQIAITSLDKIYTWSRRSSVWRLMFGLACCAMDGRDPLLTTA